MPDKGGAMAKDGTCQWFRVSWIGKRVLGEITAGDWETKCGGLFALRDSRWNEASYRRAIRYCPFCGCLISEFDGWTAGNKRRK